GDLLALPADQGIIAEGFRLLPHVVKSLLHDSSHGVWLIPTPEFRLAAFESRGTPVERPQQDQQPETRAEQPAGARSALHRAPPRRGRDDRSARRQGRRPADRGRARERRRRQIWPRWMRLRAQAGKSQGRGLAYVMSSGPTPTR